MPVIEGHLLAQVAFVVFDMGRMSDGWLAQATEVLFLLRSSSQAFTFSRS